MQILKILAAKFLRFTRTCMVLHVHVLYMIVEQCYLVFSHVHVYVWCTLHSLGWNGTITAPTYSNIWLCCFFQALQKELACHQPHYNSVVKAGKELMKSKTGETRSGLKRKLAELEQEWDTVCESANARQQKLEEAFKKVW